MSETQDQQVQDMNDAQQQIAAFPNLESMLPGGLTQEQALAFQQFQAMHGVLPVLASQFPRTAVKRRKPVKWELWEEKNLIEGVRRFGRGNWAQIRAAFEFNPCRTNVDLHDKWRVLTGERKRNRQRTAPSEQANSQQQARDTSITAEIPADGAAQKVQLVPVAGSNGLYTLASTWPTHLLDGQPVQFPPEFLQQLQQGDLLTQGPGEVIAAMHEQHHHQQQDQHHHVQQSSQQPQTQSRSDETEHEIEEEHIISSHPKKKSKKSKSDAEDEIAKELLKLSSPKRHDENSDSSNLITSAVAAGGPTRKRKTKKQQS